MNELLDELVPRDERPADWDDVLRRARLQRSTPRRLVFVAAFAAAALIVGTSVAALLSGGRGPQLPAAADRSRVAAVLDPRSGKLLVKVAPWKNHPGVCFAALVGRSACVDRGTALASLALGYTFDERVVAGSAIAPHSGKRSPLVVSHWRNLGVVFFYSRAKPLRLMLRVELRDKNGNVLHTLRR